MAHKFQVYSVLKVTLKDLWVSVTPASLISTSEDMVNVQIEAGRMMANLNKPSVNDDFVFIIREEGYHADPEARSADHQLCLEHLRAYYAKVADYQQRKLTAYNTLLFRVDNALKTAKGENL